MAAVCSIALRARRPLWTTLSRPILLKPRIQLLNPNIYGTVHNVRSFQTSSPRQAGFLVTPLVRVLVAVGARLGRILWKRMSPERRAAFKAAVRRRRGYIYAGAGGLGLAGVGYYYSHIEETPITGRRRFMMFNRKQVVELIEAEHEQVMALLLSEGSRPLPPTDHNYQLVQSMISQILSRNWCPLFEGIKWKLYVIDTPEVVNAVCLPTGEIIVFSGMLKACHNQDELALILSHEIAHAVLGHGAEGLSHRGIWEFFTLFAIGAVWAVIPSDLVSFFTHRVVHSTAEILFDFPYSRQIESEADKVGLMFATKACYDPKQAIKIWTHLPNFNVGDKAVEYLSTHPSNESRLEVLTLMLPEAYGQWQRKEECQELEGEVHQFQQKISESLKKLFKLK